MYLALIATAKAATVAVIVAAIATVAVVAVAAAVVATVARVAAGVDCPSADLLPTSSSYSSLSVSTLPRHRSMK